jgi:ABC-2 type transport system ATP-binding protein
MSTPSDEIALEVHGLRKTFRIGFLRKRVLAVEDSTFEVRRGEIFGLVGPNGAGKTTTIKMLMGLIHPDAGRGTFLGEDIRSVHARRRVGFLPEHPNFYDSLKPGELMDYYGELYGLSRLDKRARIPALLERVGLAHALDKPIRKVSKGMLQRLGLAQALLPDSELVLLDEPQSGLDPMGRKDVRDLIVELGERGRTVIFSSHILHDVERVSDRVAIIVRGRVTRRGTISDLLGARGVEVDVVVDPASADLSTAPDAVGPPRRLPGGHARFRFADEGATSALLAWTVENGATVISLERHRPQLEDIFLEDVRARDEDLARKEATP